MNSRVVEITYVATPGQVGVPLEYEDLDPLGLEEVDE